jgi:molybdopterin-guanine dinucleotide biosynthesis protein A
MTAFEALVLAGGRSTRFGAGIDKTFVLIDGVPMVHRVVGALRAAGAVRIVTVGGDRERLESVGMDIAHTDDRWPGEGPLGGLLSGLDAMAGRGAGAAHRSGEHEHTELERTELERTGSSAVVMAACDLPWLEAALVRRLVDRLDENGDIDVIVPALDGRQQHHLAIVRRRGHPACAGSSTMANARSIARSQRSRSR